MRAGQPPRHLLVHLGIVDHRVDALASTARSSTLAALRGRAGERLAEQLVGALARRGCEPQVVLAARQRERDDPRTEQLPQAADDEVEQPLEIGLGERGRCRPRCSDCSWRDQRVDAS